MVLFSCVHKSNVKASDDYIRDRVVLLHGDPGTCTGVQVIAPSGAVYVLYAAHCAGLAENGHVLALDETGVDYEIEIIDIDEVHDLMLLSSHDLNGIAVAKSLSPHEKIHTITHGQGYPSFRTDGEILEERTEDIAVFRIVTPMGLLKCLSVSNQRVELDPKKKPYCVQSKDMMMSTAPILHGSSGGPAVNDAGELIEHGIFSELMGESGKHLCYVAEHSYGGKPKLPNGTWTVKLGTHQLDHGGPQELYCVRDVPGHEGICLHRGNLPQVDSDGCLLLGEAIADSSAGREIVNSKAAFDSFMASMAGVTEFTLVVSQWQSANVRFRP
ncbi:unnamed protein product [Sphagnum balticum]